MKSSYLAGFFLFASLPLFLLFVAPANGARTHRDSADNQPLAIPATTRVVTNTADSGAGSLRQVLIDALPGETIIFTFTLPNTITLTGGELVVIQNQTISGPVTPSLLTIDGNNSGRIFNLVGGNVSISGLTIRNGNVGPSGDGGGIYNNASLTLTNSIVISNYAGSNGGGIYHSGAMLTLNSVTVMTNTSNAGGGMRSDGVTVFSNTTFLSNTAVTTGGAMENFAPATLMSVTIRGNHAFNAAGLYTQGGAMTIANSSIIGNAGSLQNGGIATGGLLTITNSSILSNTAGASDNGGVLNNGGSLWLTNVTISGNSAPNGAGGGLLNFNSGVNFLTNVTIYTNTANTGGGIDQFSGTVTLSNTILADNAGGNCGGLAVTSAGHNLDSANTCSLAASGDLTVTNPLLGPLANNGGPMLTHALLPGSPAINHGTNTGCPTTDQRGFRRVGPCDIGAYEYMLKSLLPLILK